MSKFFILLFCITLFLISCRPQEHNIEIETINFVDPFIGTAVHPELHPGVETFQGNVSVIPLNTHSGTPPSNREFYKWRRPFLEGFVHCAKIDTTTYPGLVVTPLFGERIPNLDDKDSGYSLQTASPGYYKVRLDDRYLFAEMTGTSHTSLSRFRFQNGWAHIALYFFTKEGKMGDGVMRISAINEIEGYRQLSLDNDESAPSKLYFVARFNRSAMGGGLIKNGTILPESVVETEGRAGGVFSFRTMDAGAVQLKIAFSPIGIEHARAMFEIEQPAWSFELIHLRARQSWESILSKIKVMGPTIDQTLFYTSLYRALVAANPGVWHQHRTWNPFSGSSESVLQRMVHANCAARATDHSLPASGTALENPQRLSGQLSRWRTQFFNIQPNGYPPHGSVTALSSNLCFTLLGLIPDCHGGFILVPPSFDFVEIYDNAERSLPFTLKIQRKGADAERITKAKLNKSPQASFYLQSSDIIPGGMLELTLGR